MQFSLNLSSTCFNIQMLSKIKKIVKYEKRIMKNYINFTRDFLAHKLNTLDKTKTNENFNLDELTNDLANADSFDELHAICKKISSRGLKQINILFLPIKLFFESLEEKEINNITKQIVEDFLNNKCTSLKLRYGTRLNYKNSLVSFFDYINSCHNLEKKIDIKSIVLSNIENNVKTNDWINLKELIRINKEIESYIKLGDEIQERYKDILIFNLLSFSGILPNEIISLTEDSFIFRDNEMILKIKGDSNSKNREIPLPKGLIFNNFNNYVKQRNKNIKYFFYNKEKKQLEINYILETVKKFLKFANTEVKDRTPKMLRRSYALILNNERGGNELTQNEQNIKYLLGLANTTQLRDLLKNSSIKVNTVPNIFENNY